MNPAGANPATDRVLCLALVVYFVLLARTAAALFRTGTLECHRPRDRCDHPAVGRGVGGGATLRAGLTHQRLARLAAEEGVELDVADLPRMPSGRISRDAADALFAGVRGELDADPDDWRRWYRLARAYDYAGDRNRAPARRCAPRSNWKRQEGPDFLPRLLIVHHTPSPATRELLEAVLAGAADPEISGVEVVARPALAATLPETLDADGYLFGTPANFGYMSGRSNTSSTGSTTRAWTMLLGDPTVCGCTEQRHRGRGRIRRADRNRTEAGEVVRCAPVTGPVDSVARRRAYELGGTLAAVLME